MTTRIEDSAPKIVYWHRELPPLKAELVAEHTVEANSSRVRGTIAHRDELWDQCYRELMANAESRLVQEVARLGGHFAHVHDEAIEPRARRRSWRGVAPRSFQLHVVPAPTGITIGHRPSFPMTTSNIVGLLNPFAQAIDVGHRVVLLRPVDCTAHRR